MVVVMKAEEIRNIVSELLMQDSRNITRELYRRALGETCDYIEANMAFVDSHFEDRYELLEFALKNVALEDGLWLEFGVYKGDTITFIAKRSKTTVYGFDSFEGNPDDWRREYPKGSFALKEIPEYPGNVKIVKGWFKDSLPRFLETHPDPIAFIHIDCDLYSSTKTILDELRHRLIHRSVLVFDEFFNYPGWKNHEFRAFMEFVQDNNKKYEYIGYVYRHSQVALKIID
jgi:hypothetical protein